MSIFATLQRKGAAALAVAAAFMLGVAPMASAQVQQIDPNTAIDGDLAEQEASPQAGYPPPPPPMPADPMTDESYASPSSIEPYPDNGYTAPEEISPYPQVGATGEVAAADSSTTYQEDDLIGAAEGVFGKGAEGVAGIIEDILGKQGEPNGYIVGREGGGAFILGLRYGSGTLYHKVEGQKPVYWTGPSIGFDAGANAGSTFVLVYNLYDTEQIYKRFPAGEGQAYFIGGMNASYLRSGDVVLIPIRVGAGLRLGVNAGYMKFSKEQKWLPF
jgi:hypothetical protein